MKNLILLALLLGGTAIAQNLPDYYPKKGLIQTGVINEIIADAGRIIIGDISYRMNPRPIVRTPRSAYDSMSKIRPGTRVAFRIDANGEISEFWIYPKNTAPGPDSGRGDKWRR